MKLPTVTTPVQIRFSDLDLLGHVTNSVYPQYFEIGRADWFAAIEGEEPMTVLASMNIEFIKEINFRDTVYVKTTCIKKGNKSLTLSQDIYVEDELVTKGILVIVGFDMQSRKACTLFEGWEASQ